MGGTLQEDFFSPFPSLRKVGVPAFLKNANPLPRTLTGLPRCWVLCFPFICSLCTPNVVLALS